MRDIYYKGTNNNSIKQVMDNKKCNKCNIEKPKTEFHKQHTAKDGYRNVCKVCICEQQKIYLKNNRDSILAKKKKYRESVEGKKVRKDYRKNYYDENKELENKRSNEWNKNNREIMRVYNNEYSKAYYKKYPHLRAWRRILHNSLRKLGQSKGTHTIDLLGYSAVDLQNHITLLFTEGMTWDNYGEWHIDHIKPISSFDSDTPMNVVNALSNLRPMWSTTREINGVIYEGNLNKGTKH